MVGVSISQYSLCLPSFFSFGLQLSLWCLSVVIDFIVNNIINFLNFFCRCIYLSVVLGTTFLADWECCQIGYLACFILEINGLAMCYLHGEQSFFWFFGFFVAFLRWQKDISKLPFRPLSSRKRFVVRNNLYENMFHVTFIFIQIKFTDGFSYETFCFEAAKRHLGNGL